MSDKTVFQSQLEDNEVRQELEQSGILDRALRELPVAASHGGQEVVSTPEAVHQLRTGRANVGRPNRTEAIVMRHGFPSLLIRDGDYEQPQLEVWQQRLNPHRDAIKQVISAVGRVDLRNLPAAKWVGTCWLVDETTLVTNRHVAEFFTEFRSGQYEILNGVDVFVDFREEHQSRETLEYLINSVSYIETVDAEIDLALMKLDSQAADRLGIQPIPIAETHDQSEFIGVVGYPARDSRNPVHDMGRIFQDIYNVKRFAPGKVMDPQESDRVFTHNCTTLGGNSGSAVFDIQSGAAVGLHFAGSALEANYAVNAYWLRERLVKQRVQNPGFNPTSDGELNSVDEERRVSESFADRDGYQVDFIGDGRLRVPLPRLNAVQFRDVSRTRDGEPVLNYRHLSVVMSRRRRLAYFAATNIDGGELRRPRRVGFKIDPRLDRDQQADNELYRRNDLDRGHLIRRLDPCWGTREEAEQANRDSMFYTNIAPQHKDLNQKIWLELEEHILSNTDAENAKISVFVGCLFDENDPAHVATNIKVPLGFWKVVVSATRSRNGGRSRTRRLEAQAFVLFQDHLVNQDDLELRFGGVDGVQQITVEELERTTGIDFHGLRDADTFGLEPDVREQLVTESIASHDPTRVMRSHYKTIESLSDVVLG